MKNSSWGNKRKAIKITLLFQTQAVSAYFERFILIVIKKDFAEEVQ